MEQRNLRGYHQLRAWQKADELACAVFDAIGRSRQVPWWLRDQVCRSAVSVPANIAEGYSRGSLGDYLRFLDIARGSLGETEYYIGFVQKNKLVPEDSAARLAGLSGDVGNLLFALIRSLAQKQRNGGWEHRESAVKEERELYHVEHIEEVDEARWE